MLSIRDALIVTKPGRTLIIEAQLHQEDLNAKADAVIAKIEARWAAEDRVTEIRSLVRNTFISHCPKGQRPNWDVYKAAREACLEASEIGGQVYDDLVLTVKYTWTSPANYRASVTALTTVGGLAEETDNVTEHDFSDYDSSDYRMRQVA